MSITDNKYIVSGRTLSVYAFSVDPKVTQFSSNLGQLRRHCNYSLSVVAQNQNTSMDQKLQAANERNQDIKLSKLHLENFTIGEKLAIKLAFNFSSF